MMASTRSSGKAAGHLGSLYSLGAAGSLTDGQLLDRFLDRDDPEAAEAAFSELVDRHGSMVLGVCRRELGDTDDAHDAFQATFLVLVSKASMIRRRESVGGWLFGIARRVAAKARWKMPGVVAWSSGWASSGRSWRRTRPARRPPNSSPTMVLCWPKSTGCPSGSAPPWSCTISRG